MDFIARLLQEAKMPDAMTKRALQTIGGVSEDNVTSKIKDFYKRAKQLAEEGIIPDDKSPFATDKDPRAGKFTPWTQYSAGKQSTDNRLSAVMWFLWTRVPIIDDFNSANGTSITHGDIAYTNAASDTSGTKDEVMAAFQYTMANHPELFDREPQKLTSKTTGPRVTVQNWFSMPLDKKVANYEFAMAEYENVKNGEPTLPQTLFAKYKNEGKGKVALARMKAGEELGHSQIAIAQAAKSGGEIMSTSQIKAQTSKGLDSGLSQKELQAQRAKVAMRALVPEDEREDMVEDFAKEIGVPVERARKQWAFFKDYLTDPGVNDLKDLVWAIASIEAVKKDDPAKAKMMRDMLRKVIQDKNSIPFETLSAFRRMANKGQVRGKITGKPNIIGLARFIADIIERGWREAPDYEETDDQETVSNKLYPYYLKSIKEWGSLIEFYLDQLAESVYFGIMDNLPDAIDRLDPDGALIYVIDGEGKEKAKNLRRQAIEAAVDKTLKEYDMDVMSKEYREYIYDQVQEGLFEFMMRDAEGEGDGEFSERNRSLIKDSVVKAINSGFKDAEKGSMSGQMAKIVANAISELTHKQLNVLYAALQSVRGKDSPLHKLLSDITAKRRNEVTKKEKEQDEEETPKQEGRMNTPGGRFLGLAD